MSLPVQTRVPARLARHHLVSFLVVALLAAALAAAIVGASVIRDSSEYALRQTSEAANGGVPYLLQSGSRKSRKELNAEPDLIAVADSDGTVSSGKYEMPVQGRFVSSSEAAIGVFISGRAPSGPSQVSVSRLVSKRLGVHLGSRMVLQFAGHSRTATVTGITVVPADVDAAQVSSVDPDLTQASADVWLSPRDPAQNSSILRLLDQRQVTFRSSTSLAASASSTQPEIVSTMSRLCDLAAYVLLAVLAAVTFGAVLSCRVAVRTLQVAGMSSAKAWNAVGLIVIGVLVGGEAIGALAVGLLGTTFREPVSNAFGQHWTATAYSWTPAILLVLSTVGVAVTVRYAARLAFGWLSRLKQRSLDAQRVGKISGIALFVGALLIGAGLVSRHLTTSGVYLGFARIGACIFSVALIGLLGARQNVFWRGAGVVSRRLTSRLVLSALVAGGAASTIIVWTGTEGALETQQVSFNEQELGDIQPVGSYLLSQVPGPAVRPLLRVYQATGGSSFSDFSRVEETHDIVRVTTPSLVTCMKNGGLKDPSQAPQDCWGSHTSVPINLVVLGPRTSTTEAGSDLVQSGEVGLLTFTPQQNPNTSQPSATTQIAAAQQDVRLGGLLPGLVVPVHSKLAEHLSLRPDGSHFLTLWDYAKLDPRAQARFRSAVARLAPGSEVSDGTLPTMRARERSTANRAIGLGALLGALLLLAGGAAALQANRNLFSLVRQLGAADRWRLRFVVAAIAPFVASLVGAVPLMSISISIGGLGRGNGDPGRVWLIGPVLGLIVCAVLSWQTLRMLRRNTRTA